jgi:hypothetical protein
MMNTSPLADPDRFRPIENSQKDFPELGFTGADSFALDDGGLLITDPTFLADVYNPNDDPVAAYLRANGVIVYGFGGDETCAVWWKEPFLLLPLSLCSPRDPAAVAGAIRVADRVVCDSGSFLFLPLRADQPSPVRSAVEEVFAKGNGVRIQLPLGRYRVFYEQHDPPKRWPRTFARDVVLCRE